MQALETGTTLSITASVFRRLCTHHPDVDRLLIIALAGRVRELSARLLEAQYVGLDRRLYRRLLELHILYGEAPIPLTQQQLADLVGGTRPSVNQVLQRLVSQQIVELARGQLSIKNHAALITKASL